MLRSFAFALLQKNALSPDEFIHLHLALHELYSSGQPIIIDNMSANERDIALSLSSRRLHYYYIDAFLERVARNGDSKQIYHGMALYRTEIVPILAQYAADPAYITSMIHIRLGLELRFAEEASFKLSLIRSKSKKRQLKIQDNKQYWRTLKDTLILRTGNNRGT